MSKLILLFCMLILQLSFSQEKIILEKASDNIEKIISNQIEKGKPNIFIADIETIDSIVKLTKKKYTIIYSFSDKCHSCIEAFPTLIEYVKKHSDKFELLPIIGHKKIEITHFEEYLNTIKYYQPVYLLDENKYGKKKNPFSRIDKLVQVLCKECDYKKMGFSSFFVINEKNNIVLHNNWNVVGIDKINQLKQLVKDE